jgi:hypothetical protein
MVADAVLPKPLFHEYETPPVAVTLIEVVVHVNSVTPVLLVMPAIGAVVFDVTMMLAVEVQPLAPVTVTVYVPADVIEADAALPKPLFHEYETPPVAVTLIEVVVHVNSVTPVLLVIPAIGAVVFDVTVMLAVDEQPLELFAVTVYVPADVMVADAVLPKPLFHEYETPPVAVTLIEVVVHVNSVTPVLLVIPAIGAVVFDVTVMLAVEVQPLAPVTVTV